MNNTPQATGNSREVPEEVDVAYKSVLDDLRKCIALEEPGRVPCFPLGLDFHVRDCGFTHRQFRTDPEAMVRVGRSVVEEYDYDWFILHPDDLIEYEDIGIAVKHDENIPPAVVEYLPATESTFANLKLPAEPGKETRMALHLEGLRGLGKELGGQICLTGRIAAPFSAVSLVLGIEATLFLMLEKPGLLIRFMDFFVEYNDAYAQAQLEAGADAIWLGDCVATSHFISPRHYETFAAEYADTSSKLIQEKGGIVFYHGCETSIPHLEIMAGLSFGAINIGEGIDIAAVKRAIGGTKCIMGNLDPVGVLQQESPEGIERETRTIVEKGKEHGGYVFCTGEGIPSNTPKENVRSMVRAVRACGEY